jgi:erythromycin esterase-like protein
VRRLHQCVHAGQRRPIHRPETERASHYFFARLAHQFDAIVHCDETRAVEPLERTALWETGEVPETFTFGV